MHFEDTIHQKVASDRIYDHISTDLQAWLRKTFGAGPIAVWGSRDSKANRAKFEKMRLGDDILIIKGETIILLGKIAATTINADLSNELWKPLKGNQVTPWNLIYFIANPKEIDLPFTHFCKLMGYAKTYKLRGFTTVSEDRLESFYSRYDDLYSILLQIKQGRPVHQLPQRDLFGQPVDIVQEQAAVMQREDLSKTLPEDAVSDHIKMQWLLSKLGDKAGSKVWIPKADQSRIRESYHFDQFESDLTAGLDTQTRYVENIDVVWKEEFRIDAAFEIENSTAIYSGLLRFADLTLVAPNTIYPLFIVAPREKRNRLVEQLKRPAFRELGLDKKVRYLSYEAVEEIDNFFGGPGGSGTGSGLTVEVIKGKSEEIDIRR